MNKRFTRRNVLRSLPVAAAAAITSAEHAQTYADLRLEPQQPSYKPLQRITVHAPLQGRFTVRDGAGNTYAEAHGTSQEVIVSGALGTHTVQFTAGSTTATRSFAVHAQTEIIDPKGDWQHLLGILHWTMASEAAGTRRHDGVLYPYFVDWILDDTNARKGMRYFSAEARGTVDFFATTQREDGMIWENHLKRTPPFNDWDRRFQYGDFSRAVDDGFVGLRRAPVENHVEGYFLEALHLAWKTTGDDAWMSTHLDAALRAVHYATTDPYRWSTKHQLLKRGLTIDTWDFLCDSEAAIAGDTMAVHLNRTHFGIFFGDNHGIIAGCRALAEMLQHAGRTSDAQRMITLADGMETRLNALAWNGRHFTHWIAEDETFHPDMGVDMHSQVTLSNAYALNRGITSQQANSIVATYQGIRRTMPQTSPGEWYSVYPPFPKGFEKDAPMWSYVNGGVLSCTAGELARGALQHGHEAYGVDVLQRVLNIAHQHRNFLPAILLGKAPQALRANYTTISIDTAANCDTGKGTADVKGWVGEKGNFLNDFPGGEQTFRGIPFHLLAATATRRCIGLAQASGYTATASIAVGTRARSFYLLHAASGGQATMARAVLHYRDGTQHTVYMERGVNCNTYWAPQDGEYNTGESNRKDEHMQVAWRGKSDIMPNVGVWITAIPITHDDVLDRIEFHAAENGMKYFVLGITVSDATPWLQPKTDLSFGMPNNWGAGCTTAALLEGLAGVRDTGAAFSTCDIAPRWLAADVPQCDVTVHYPASNGYVAYSFQHTANQVTLHVAGSANQGTLRILLPAHQQVATIHLNDVIVKHHIETINESRYAVIAFNGIAAKKLTVTLQ